MPTDLNGLRMLDVGFGAGQLTHALVTNSGRSFVNYKGIPYIMGIDIDPVNIEFAEKYMPIYKKVLLRDAVDIPYPSEFTKDLSIVFCTQVVEHIEDKKKALDMIKYLSTLAPIVIFSCPQGDTTKTNSKHKSIWYRSNFKKLGFNTALTTIYPSMAVIILDFFSLIKNHRRIIRNIIAWKINEKIYIAS